MSFDRLTFIQRKKISEGLSEKQTLTAIAAAIGVHKSTVSRELKRNSDPITGVYDYLKAELISDNRKSMSGFAADDTRKQNESEKTKVATNEIRIKTGNGVVIINGKEVKIKNHVYRMNLTWERYERYRFRPGRISIDERKYRIRDRFWEQIGFEARKLLRIAKMKLYYSRFVNEPFIGSGVSETGFQNFTGHASISSQDFSTVEIPNRALALLSDERKRHSKFMAVSLPSPMPS